MLRICFVCLVFICGSMGSKSDEAEVPETHVTAAVPVDLRHRPKPDGTEPDKPKPDSKPDLHHRSESKRHSDNARRHPNSKHHKHILRSEPKSLRVKTLAANDNPRRPQQSLREKNIGRIRNKFEVQYEVGGHFVRGGNLTDTLNYPYMAAVMINGRLWCAGAIVDVGWVLTAAHCLNYVLSVLAVKSLNRYVKVRVGSVKPHEGGELIDVAGAVRHPKFEEEPVPHADVALLKLERILEFSKFINLIRIYDGSREPYAQSFVTVAGWGATTGSATAFREQTSTMLMARLKVRTQHYCEDAYQLVNGFQFAEDMFCASLRNGTRDACLFDAGAPAVQHNALMGIMSFGPERCGGMQPAVFIKALYFRDFVKHTIVQYKTTSELIEAMKEAESVPRPPMMNG